jgi:hypothetical protein
MRRFAGPARWEGARGAGGAGGARGGAAALSERYLEALDEEPDEDDLGGAPASERFRAELHRPRAQARIRDRVGLGTLSA